jgi:hypothetical protein
MPGHVVGVKQKKLGFLAFGRRRGEDEKGEAETGANKKAHLFAGEGVPDIPGGG